MELNDHPRIGRGQVEVRQAAVGTADSSVQFGGIAWQVFLAVGGSEQKPGRSEGSQNLATKILLGSLPVIVSNDGRS